jgi:hypothetical protein
MGREGCEMLVTAGIMTATQTKMKICVDELRLVGQQQAK